MAIGIGFLRLADALWVVLPQIKAESDDGGAFRLRWLSVTRVSCFGWFRDAGVGRGFGA